MPIATSAELRAARASRTVRKRTITCGRPMIPSVRPMLRDRLFSETVPSERSGTITSSPNRPAASCIGPSGFQPVREMSDGKTSRTMNASRLVLKIWMYVVATMPPRSVYTVISAPSRTTAMPKSTSSSRPAMSPAPTNCTTM